MRRVVIRFLQPEVRLSDQIPYQEYKVEVYDGRPLTLVVVRGEEIIPGTIHRLKEQIEAVNPEFVGLIVGVPPGLDLEVWEEDTGTVKN